MATIFLDSAFITSYCCHIVHAMTQRKKPRKSKQSAKTDRMRLTAYVRPKDGDIVKRACLIADKSISQLVKEATLKEAQRIIAEHEGSNQG